MTTYLITCQLILCLLNLPVHVSSASISANFINSGGPDRMTFIVNFDTASVICQKSANPEDLAIFPISSLCNGVRQCLASPNMDDESIPFCSHSCNPPCGPHGTCLLDGGKAQCYCDQGYSGKDCTVEDSNECAKKPCHWLAKCTNTFGSYYCSCLPGFSGDGVNCTDIDECAIESIAKKCPLNSECSNVPGAHFCNCTDGYRPHGQPLRSCDDIDECEENLAKCPPGTICLNTPGSYKCTTVQDDVAENCSTGYERKGGKCVDIDECQKTDSCAARASCLNTEGGYRCVCPSGFTGDGKTCTPLTDCSSNPSICHPNAFCVPDLRMCLCQSGYIGDGITCFDMNECVSDHPVCKNDQRCVNTNGSYVCCPRDGNDRACLEAHGTMCPEACGKNAECIRGQCLCKPGYAGSPTDGCSDVNECQDNPNICPIGQRCVNLEGGHVCCYHGAPVSKCQGLVVGIWKKDKAPKKTTPLFDQVAQTGLTTTSGTPTPNSKPADPSSGDCSESQKKYCELHGNKTCTFIDGHPECSQCRDGFVAVAGECIAVDGRRSDCNDSTKNDCDQHAVCLDLSPSGHLCACKDGFIGDGIRCDDVDECYTPNLCSPNAKCMNQVGSYQCVCNTGFTGDGHFCAAIGVDCGINPRICGENAKCMEKQCACNSGYTRNGSRCIDIDECSEKTCDEGRQCFNLPGNFACCPGKNDQEKELCTTVDKKPCSNGDCKSKNDCRSNPTLCHPNAQCNVTGDGHCYCSLGYIGDGYECKVDPDDCFLNIALCDLTRSRCVDRRCQCLDGFQGNGTNCQAESCDARPSVCHRNADCLHGQCTCKDGYVGNGFTCVPDPNDCDAYPTLCHSKASCVMRRCHCNDGYDGDGKTCAPIDAKDCRFSPDICAENAFCNETRCHCKVGYLGNGESGCWADPEDCVISPSRCPSSAECVERRCKCNKGYLGNGTTCDLDPQDCQFGSLKCDVNARCLDNKCKCLEGYEGDGVKGCEKLENVEFDPRIPSQNDLSNSSVNVTDIPSLNFGLQSTTPSNFSTLAPGSGPRNRTQCFTAAVGDCHQNADCVERERGAYACQCLNGFTGDGRDCQDINECSLRLANCHSLATCVNTQGSHLCMCQEGYQGDGVRECAQRNDTGLRNRLDLECQDDGIVLVYADSKDSSISSFNGRIFVKTQSRNPYCSKDFTSGDGPVYKFKAPYHYCDVKMEPHNTFSTVAVIQKHPLFVTDADEAYNLRCTYPVGEVPIMSHFNVSMLSTAGYYVSNGTQPQCSLKVMAQDLVPGNSYRITGADDSSQWKEITEATVGQKVQLILTVEPKTLYGIVAKNCIALNMDSGETYQLTNSHGCALDPGIFPEWTQDQQYQLSAKFLTFKWPDTAHIRFQCDCSPCFEKCEPVQCGANAAWGRKKRSEVEELMDSDLPPSNPVFSTVLQIKDTAGSVKEEWQDEADDEKSSNQSATLLQYYGQSPGQDDASEDICINSVIFATGLGLAVSLAVGVCVVGFGNWQGGLLRSLGRSSSIGKTTRVSFKYWMPSVMISTTKYTNSLTRPTHRSHEVSWAK